MNLVMLIGRLTRDPELRYLANTGTPLGGVRNGKKSNTLESRRN